MKISVNDQELFTLSEIQKKVIQNDILSEIFDEDMKRRLKWILLDEKYEKCFARLKKEWCEDKDKNGQCKLSANGISSIPVDPDALAQLIVSQKNYKSRSQREKEANNI